LPQQAASAGTDGEANRHLVPARERPDEKQVSDVGTDDEQNKHRDNNHDFEGRKQMTGVIERRFP
jgi:hypothetical protein